MNHRIKLMIGILSLFSAVLVGCQEGPAEKEGKKIDKTVSEVSNKMDEEGALEKVGKKLDNSAKTVKKELKEKAKAAGEKIDNAVKAINNKLDENQVQE